MSNFAAKITEQNAEDLAKVSVEAFKCEKNDNFYTYEEIAIENALTYTQEEITEEMNDEMFIIEWNGTSPVFKNRKMFPR